MRHDGNGSVGGPTAGRVIAGTRGNAGRIGSFGARLAGRKPMTERGERLPVRARSLSLSLYLFLRAALFVRCRGFHVARPLSGPLKSGFFFLPSASHNGPLATMPSSEALPVIRVPFLSSWKRRDRARESWPRETKQREMERERA